MPFLLAVWLAVAGMICIRPMAPALEAIAGWKMLSLRMMAKIFAGLMPCWLASWRTRVS